MMAAAASACSRASSADSACQSRSRGGRAHQNPGWQQQAATAAAAARLLSVAVQRCCRCCRLSSACHRYLVALLLLPLLLQHCNLLLPLLA